jgi:uncharacterized protein (TIGR03435 family)
MPNKTTASDITAGINHKRSVGRKISLTTIGAAFLAMPLALGLVNPIPLHAQLLHADGPLPSFEVATIRPGHPDDKLRFRMAPAELNIENASVTDLIRFAYSVKSSAQLPKSPHWIDTDKFDINAKIGESQFEAMKKIPPNQRFDQFRLMVQSLLADRFALKLSIQKKDLPVYALVVAKGTPKLTAIESSNTMPGLDGSRRGQLKATGVSMPFFIDWVSRQPETGERAVIDATSLKGTYNFELNWSPDDGHAQLLNGQPVEPTGPSFFTALQEQLGLKLESQKAPVEVLIIDQVEHPSEN